MAELVKQVESGGPEIRLTHSWFSLEEFQGFTRELRDVETVTSIFLRSDRINDQMVVALAEALKHNKSVKELFLSENLIGDVGATALSLALKVNKTLEILYLNENKITDEGAHALMLALQTNSTLKRLFLIKNPITIDTSLEYKLNLRGDYTRMLAICALGIPRLARNSHVFPLPNDVLRVIRSMLSNEWSLGYKKAVSS